MQINVTCQEMTTLNGEKYWAPVPPEIMRNHSDGLKTSDKAFYADFSKIVWIDPRTREVALDDGTSDGTIWIVGETSAKFIQEILS